VAAAQVANRVAGKLAQATRHRALLGERRSLLLTLGYVGHCWELFGMWAWVPAFLIASLGDRLARDGAASGAIGLGIAIAIALHLSGFLASVTMGRTSDRYGRRTVLIVMAGIGALCSFGFGWSGQLSPALLLAFAALYGFTALGDSSVLSTAMSEAVPAAYLGRALAIRSILGIGIGAAAPVAFGAVLDRAAPGQAWGWAFALMGVGGIIATVCAVLLPSASRTSPAFPDNSGE
jgi:MFS family permease